MMTPRPAAAAYATLLLLVVLSADGTAGASDTAAAAVTASAARSLQAAPKSEWVVVLNRGVGGNDLTDCKAGSAKVAKERGAPSSSSSGSSGSSGSSSQGCRVCGGAPAVAAACSAEPKCVAFVMHDREPGCGYLKSSVKGQADRVTHTLYCDAAKGATCKGQFSFTPKTGMMFTGDYRCAFGANSGGGSNLCFMPGNINAVGAGCLKDAKCRAFAYNRADQGGYFKSTQGVASPTSGSDLYLKI